MLKLSVIIPIYNVEPFLEKCIYSLLKQDIPREEYEIICVNDGSPDKSREIVLRFQTEFHNIILIDQKNMGVSQARNSGLDKASGKYLLFVDPDDFIEENSLGSILMEADSNHAQMTIPGYTFLDDNGNVKETKIFSQNTQRIFSGIEAYYLMREEIRLIADSSVGIIFEREYIQSNQLRYLPNVTLNQDVELLARIHCMADRCIFVNQPLYVAFSRRGSATRSNQFNTDKVRNGFIRAAGNLKQFKESVTLKDSQTLFLNGPIAQFVLLSLYSASRSRSIGNLTRTSRDLKSTGLKTLDLTGCRGYHKICGKAYNLSPYLGSVFVVFYLVIKNQYRKLIMNRRRAERKKL